MELHRVGRRRFLYGAGALGAAALAAAACDDDRPPARTNGSALETTTIRLTKLNGVCIAPQFVAEELLRAESFTDVRYHDIDLSDFAAPYPSFAAGEIDISMAFVAPFIVQLEKGVPIVLLGGVHSGCFELFGTEQVRSVRDLKGRTVAVPNLSGSHYMFVASMVTHIGLDPNRDINWVTLPFGESIEELAAGRVDALIGFAPVPQELREKKIGHVVVNSVADRPWSQYFCCLLAGRREFVRQNPVATKRALRAIVKATEICANEPERVAQLLVEKKYTASYDYALQAMQELPYTRWRELDPEDTVRFYALRLQEAGMIKSSPKKVIAQGTDWRYFNELKKELKA
jgi:NitT/TauT family transport system substrate-binding protein